MNRTGLLYGLTLALSVGALLYALSLSGWQPPVWAVLLVTPLLGAGAYSAGTRAARRDRMARRLDAAMTTPHDPTRGAP